MHVRHLPLVLCLAAAFMPAAVAHASEGRRAGPQRSVPPSGPMQPPREEPVPSRTVDASPRVLRQDGRARRSGRQDALADSVRRVQSRTGGQVLSAERIPFEGRDINRVKVVDDKGRVRVYMDDPTSRPRRPPRPTRGNDD